MEHLAIAKDYNVQPLLFPPITTATSVAAIYLHRNNLISSNFFSTRKRAAIGKCARRLTPITSSTTTTSSGGERMSLDSPAKALRRLLDSPGIHQGPACFDALSAKLVKNAGFDFCFTSGKFFLTLLFDASVFGIYDKITHRFGEMPKSFVGTYKILHFCRLMMTFCK